MSGEEKSAIERHLTFARELHVETRTLGGDDVAEALLEFARTHQITQIFLSRPRKTARFGAFGGSLIHQIVRMAGDMQVTVVAERKYHKVD